MFAFPKSIKDSTNSSHSVLTLAHMKFQGRAWQILQSSKGLELRASSSPQTQISKIEFIKVQ